MNDSKTYIDADFVIPDSFVNALLKKKVYGGTAITVTGPKVRVLKSWMYLEFKQTISAITITSNKDETSSGSITSTSTCSLHGNINIPGTFVTSEKNHKINKGVGVSVSPGTPYFQLYQGDDDRTIGFYPCVKGLTISLTQPDLGLGWPVQALFKPLWTALVAAVTGVNSWVILGINTALKAVFEVQLPLGPYIENGIGIPMPGASDKRLMVTGKFTQQARFTEGATVGAVNISAI